MISKQLNRIDIFSIALGSVIGWGAFMLPGNVFLVEAGVINTLIGFLFAVLMIFFIEKSYASLITKYPKTGGEYTFAKQVFGERVGFFTGWLLLLAYVSIIPLNATAIPMVIETIVPDYNKGVELYNVAGFSVHFFDLIISLFFIICFTILNYKGLNGSKQIQNITVFILILSLLIVLTVSAYQFDDINYFNVKSNSGEVNVNAIIRIIAFAPWAFIGFDNIAQMSEEYKIKPKSASFAALLAVIAGALVYNALNIITAIGVHSSELSTVTWATGQAVKNIGGNGLLYIVGIAIFVAVISGLNGFFLSSTRLIFAMSSNDSNDSNIERTKIIPGWVFLFVGLISCAVPFFGRNALFWFVDLSSVGASFAYLVTCCAAFKLSTNSINKIWYTFGIISSFFFIVFLLTPFFGTNIPSISIYVLFAWLLLGFVAYNSNFYVNKRKVDNCFNV